MMRIVPAHHRTLAPSPLSSALLLASALLVAGCGGDSGSSGARPLPDTAGPVPVWVDHPPRESGKLFGVGSARPQDRAGAEARARAAIAAQLEVAINATTTSTENVSIQEGAAGRAESYFANIDKKVAQSVNQEALPGTTVVETAEGRGEVHVLVEFDRAGWAAGLRTRLAAVDQGLTPLAQEIAATETARIALAIEAAAPLLAERATLVRRLALADPGSRPAVAPLDRRAAAARLAALLGHLRIAFAPGLDPELAARLQEALAKQGFTVLASGGDLRFDVAVTLRQISAPTFQRFNAAGTLTVTDPGSNRVLGSLSAETSGSHADAGQAKAKAIANLATEFTVLLDAQIVGLIARRNP